MSKKLSDEERFQLDRPPEKEPDYGEYREPTWQELAESYIKEHGKEIKALDARLTDLEGHKEEKEPTQHGRAQGLYQALIDIRGIRGIEHVSTRYTDGDPGLVDYVNHFNEGKNWALNHLRNTIIVRIHECGHEPGSQGLKKLDKEA